MTDFKSSTQFSEWFFDSDENFRGKQKNFYLKMHEKIDKYTHKPAPS